MAVNKVEINGETKLDLTQDTVTPETLLSGVTAHNAAGKEITGSGDFVTKNEAQGYVTEHNQSADAHSDIREALAKAGSLVIHVNIETNSETGKPKITLDKTYAEIANAFNSGRNAVIVLSDKDGDYDVEQLFELTGAFASPTINGTVTYYRFECTKMDNTQVTFGAISVGGDDDIDFSVKEVPTLSDYRPLPPGNEASPGTDPYAARSDHVHPSERPKAAQVTLTAAGWNASTKKQTVTVSGVLADTSKQVIWVTFASETALDAYMDAGIVPVAQGANTVTFRADKVPTADISVTVLMQGVLT